MPETAVGYIRVSTSDQVDNGVSLKAQRERIGAYALAQGLKLVEILVPHPGLCPTPVVPTVPRLLANDAEQAITVRLGHMAASVSAAAALSAARRCRRCRARKTAARVPQRSSPGLVTLQKISQGVANLSLDAGLC